MAAVLALLSSVMWGVSDFIGGLTSRRFHALQVAALSMPVGILPLAVFTLLAPGGFSLPALGLGALAGAAGLGGIVLLYVVLAAGPMGVVSPLTAVICAVVPVGAGLLIGERPGLGAYVGMALTVVAIVLVSLEPRYDDDALHQRIAPRVLALSVLSGVLMGTYLLVIGLAPQDSGLWPVLLARVVSATLVIAYAWSRLRSGTVVAAAIVPAIAIGLLDASANALFRLAAQSGLLAVVSVLAALYPAGTVLLARFYLRERLRPSQQLGMVAALVAAALLALS